MALRNQEIGARLRELRGQKPQTTVADELGVAERTYQNWEAGDAKPSYRNLQRLAEYFGVREDYILAGEQVAVEPEPEAVSPLAGPDALAEALGVLEAKVDQLAANQAKLLDLFQTSFEHWAKQGDNIFHRLDAMEKALKTETDALLPGVRELLDLASSEDPAQASDSSTSKAS